MSVMPPRLSSNERRLIDRIESLEQENKLLLTCLGEQFQAGADAARRECAEMVNSRRFDGETDLRSIRDEIRARVGQAVKEK